MPVWVKLDALLCLSIGFLLKLTGRGILLLTGAGYLGLQMYGVFEYGDGLFDLSTLEVIALLLFAALIYRHYNYCKRFNSSFWSGLSRPVYAFGWLAFIIGTPLIVFVVIQTELNRSLDIFETSEIKLVEWFLNLVVLYLSAPCSLKQITQDGIPETQRSNPTEQKTEVDNTVASTPPEKEKPSAFSEPGQTERVKTRTVNPAVRKPVSTEPENNQTANASAQNASANVANEQETMK